MKPDPLIGQYAYLVVIGIILLASLAGAAERGVVEHYRLLANSGLWRHETSRERALQYWNFVEEAGFDGIWDIMNWRWEKKEDWFLRAKQAGIDIWPQVQGFGRLDENGRRRRGGWWKTADGREIYWRGHLSCFSDPDHLRAAVTCTTDFLKGVAKPDNGYSHWAGMYPISIMDEPCWPGGGGMLDFACYCEHCQAGFRRYLKDVVYQDDVPNADSNGDGRTFRGDCGIKAASWDDVSLPTPGQRKSAPYLWYHFMNFRPWAMGQFYREVKKAINPQGAGMATHFFGMAEHPNYGAMLGVKHYDWYPSRDILEIEHTGCDHPIPRLDFFRWEYINKDKRLPMHRWIHIFGELYEPDKTDYNLVGRGAGLESAQDIVPRTVSRTYARTLMHEFKSISLFALGRPQNLAQQHPEMWREFAYWNFFIKAHEQFLLKADIVRPRTAILFPWTGALFHDPWEGPHKMDYEWGGLTLLAGQYPVTPIGEDYVVKENALDDFDLLYLFSIDRLPKQVRDKIETFHAAGGWLWADSNSLTQDVAKADTTLFEQVFRATPAETLKGPRTVVMDTDDIVPAGTTFEVIGSIMAVQPGEGATVLARCEGKPVMVAAERAVWCGFELGKNIFAFCPPQYANSEPQDLYGTNDRRVPAMSLLKPYIETALYAARQAEVTRPVSVSRDGRHAYNIETGVRADPDSGVKMLILINHEVCVDGFYDVSTPVAGEAVAWDLLHNSLIASETDGHFPVHIPPRGVAVVLVGPTDAVAAMARAQQDAVIDRPLPDPYRFRRWWQAHYQTPQ